MIPWQAPTTPSTSASACESRRTSSCAPTSTPTTRKSTRACTAWTSVWSPISYNVYNLALQHYYEGKETSFKRAQFFDGFLDAQGVESVSDGSVTLTVKALRNGHEPGKWRYTMPAELGPLRLDMAEPVLLLPGDGYSLQVRQDSGPWLSLKATIVSSKFYLRCDVHVSYAPGSGGLTARSQDLGGAWGRALLWGRSSGGAVTPTLTAGPALSYPRPTG